MPSSQRESRSWQRRPTKTAYWLDIVDQAKLATPQALHPLQCEARELTAIFSRAAGTARLNSKR
jgi:hypothetical protein